MGVEIGKVYITKYPLDTNTRTYPLWLEYGEYRVTLTKPLVIESGQELIMRYELHKAFRSAHDNLDSAKIVLRVK